MKSSAWEDQTEINIRERAGRRKQNRLRQPSVASLIECRIEPSELDPCVGCGELPIDACALVVSE